MKPALQNFYQKISFATILALLFFASENASAQLNGTNYTINSGAAASATNYQNFTSAIGDINSGVRTDGGTPNGPNVSGIVTFTVTAGLTFNEAPITFSYTNPGNYAITFIKGVGSPDPVLSGTTGTGGGDAVLTISGSNNIIFNGIDLANNPANNSVAADMEIGLNLTGSYTNITYENGNIILNNYAGSGTPETVATFNIKGSGVASSGLGVVNIIGNTMSNKAGVTGAMGLNLTSVGNGSSINNNIITSVTTVGTITGISGVGTGTSVNVYQNTLSLTPVTGVTGIVGASLGTGSSIYQNSITVAAVTLGAASLGISETGALTNISIYGNTISPVTMGTTFTWTGINVPSIGAGASIYQNSIGLTTMGTSAAWTGINVSAAATAAGTGATVYGNTVSETTTAGTGAYTGILATTMGTGNASTTPGSGGIIHDNNITITGFATASIPYGINAGTSMATAIGPYCQIYNNTVTVNQKAALGSLGPTGIVAIAMGTGGQISNNNITVTTSAGQPVATAVNPTGFAANGGGGGLFGISAGTVGGTTFLGNNCNIYGNTISLTETTPTSACVGIGIYAIYAGTGDQFYNNAVTINVTASAYGLYFGNGSNPGLGANSSVYGNTITANQTYASASVNVNAMGIVSCNMGNGATIHDNTVSASCALTTTVADGIFSCYNNNTNIYFYNNKITIPSTTAGNATGMTFGVNSGVTGTINVYANTLNISTSATAALNAYGLNTIAAPSGATVVIGNNSTYYNNVINVTGSGGAQGIMLGLAYSTPQGSPGNNITIYGNTINAKSTSTTFNSNYITQTIGIDDLSDGNLVSIYNNVVTAICLTATGAVGPVVIGINAGGGTGTRTALNYIYGNTITAMLKAGASGTAYSALGIQETCTSTGNRISGNTISVNSQSVTAATLPTATAEGIYYNGGGLNPLIYNNTITNNRTGTINTTAAGTSPFTVTGTGTKFSTEIAANDSLTVNGVYLGRVAAVGSSTSLTLTAAATNTSLTAANFAVPSVSNLVGIGVAAAATIYGNTINGLTSGRASAAVAYGLDVTGIGTTANSNIFTNIYSMVSSSNTGTSTGANVAGIYIPPTTGNGSNVATCYGNIISNVASGAGISSTTTYGNSYGIFATPYTSTGLFNYIYGNSISNIYNLQEAVNGTGTSANAYGIYAGYMASCNFYQNTISNVHLDAATSTGEATGMTVVSGTVFGLATNMWIHENKIFTIKNATTTATGNANGIRINPGGSLSSFNTYNNFVYDISASGGTLTTLGGATRGIYMTTGANYSENFYYNTIYLNETATGSATHVSTCLYLTTAGECAVWNNIMVNNSAVNSNGSSFAYALWHSTATYPTSESNNLLYSTETVSDPSGSQHFLFNKNGAKFQTIAAYKAQLAANGMGDGTTSHTLTVAPGSFFKSITSPIDVHLIGTSATDAYLQGSVLNSTTSPSLFSALMAVAGTSAGGINYLPPVPSTDIDGDPRPTPGATTIGADEPACASLVQPSAFTTSVSSISPCAANKSYAVPNISGALFLWTVPTGVIINYGQGTDSINVTFLPAYVSGGTISVATTTANPGCSPSTSTARSITVTVNALGVGSITGPTTVCQSVSAAYIAYIPNAVSYAWTPPSPYASGTSDSAAIILTWGNTPGTYPFLVTGLDACNNTATVSYSVTVSSSSIGTGTTATATSSGTFGGNAVCNGGSVTLMGTSTDPSSTFSWIGPNGYTSSSQNPVISNMTSPLASGQYMLNVTDGGGCQATAYADVSVDQLTTASITAATSAVCGASTELILYGAANINSASNTFSWSGPAGYNSSGASQIVSTTLSVGGVFDLTVTDAAGCSATATSTTISYSPLPTVTTSAITAICQGYTTAALNGAFTAPATGAVWSDGGAGGFFTNNGGGSPNLATYTAGAGSGTPVTLTLISSGGTCGVATSFKLVTVNTTTVASASALPNPACTGGTLSLTGGPAAMTSYSWSGPNSYTNATQSPNLVNPTTSAAGVYTLTITNSNGCTSSASTASIAVNTSPAVTITPPSGNICVGNVLPQSAIGAPAYVWSPSTGLDVSTGSSVNASPITTTTYTITGTSAQGCTTSVMDTITVRTLPPLVVSPANAVCLGGTTATLTASGANTYSWAPVANLTPSAGTSAIETAQISQLTFYTVTGTGVNLCTASVVVPVATVATGGTISPTSSIICSGNTILLTVSGAAGHDYQWQISTDDVTWTNIAGATNTTYITASGDGATLKYYRLQSNSNACWNVASTTAIVDISNPAITVTPTNVTDQTITLNWTPVGSGNYTVSWSGTSAGSSSNATPPKTITGLTPGGTYSITVTQTGASLTGCPANGTIASVTTLCSAPTGVTATTPTNNQMIVSWTGAVGNYRVFYRPLFTANAYYTQDVTGATSATITRMGNNILPASTTYEVYVSSKDCPASGVIGQPSSKIYVTTPPALSCPTPIIDNVQSTCPIQIEVFMHTAGNYQIYFQRLTPTIQGVVSYPVTGNYFTVNIGSAGQTYLIAAASNCGGGSYSNLVIWPGNVTVKPLCSTINNLVLSSPTCHGFTASWNIDQCLSNNVSYYQIYLRSQGSVNWNSYPVVPIPPAPIGPYKLVNWLSKGTVYQVYVRSIYSCNGYNTAGPASNILTDATLSSGCKDDDQETSPEQPSVQQYSQDKSEVLSIYPNPNNGEFMLDISRTNNNEDKVRVEVLNMLGQTVMTNLTSISGGMLSEFMRLPNTTASGNYFVRVTVGNNVYTTKINISR